MPFLYCLLQTHTLRIQQFRHALQLVVNKHESLRTALIFNEQTKQIIQRIIDIDENKNELFDFIETNFETDEQLNSIMDDEKRNSHLFNLETGHVFRCHILHYGTNSCKHILSDKDAIIFNFHRAIFDFSSLDIFLQDLNQAYSTGELASDDTILRYRDCKYMSE